MLKFTDYDIVFQEIPDETTLAVNLSLCPNRCPGCHSPQLWQDIGTPLTETTIDSLLAKYGSAITCMSLMGGDNDPAAVCNIARYIHRQNKKAAWYSGKQNLPDNFPIEDFDYIKLGPYIAALGGLDKPTTNQRLYKIIDGKMTDISSRMLKHL